MFKILAQKWKHARESNRSKRGFHSYFIAVHNFISKSKTSNGNFTAAPDFSKDSKTTKSRIISQFLTVFAWRQQQRPKFVAWVLPRPQYWFETLFHSNALNMWWKENFRVSRETFNFICATVGHLSVTSAIADELPLVAYSGI